jgi:hypothetical protein
MTVCKLILVVVRASRLGVGIIAELSFQSRLLAEIPIAMSPAAQRLDRLEGRFQMKDHTRAVNAETFLR